MKLTSTSPKKLMIVFGTRPEAIKLAPVIECLKSDTEYETIVCSTGQHKEMLDQVLDIFRIKPDVELRLMTSNQTLNSLAASLLTKMNETIEKYLPSAIVVQGDTTTAMVAALAAFHSKVKIIHVEAGLRSHDRQSPFPEEANRKIISQLADVHFAPTDKAYENLRKESTSGELFVVGNTVIDALQLCRDKLKAKGLEHFQNRFSQLDSQKKMILVTGHRRENFGQGFESICAAIKKSAGRHKDVEFVFVTHLNPKVKVPVEKALGSVENIHLIEPVQYDDLVYLLDRCFLVLTDSGGIQEEAPSFGKPILVMREVTERTEGIEAGTAKLVGTCQETIANGIDQLLSNKDLYKKMANTENPYGNGTSASQIIKVLKKLLV